MNNWLLSVKNGVHYKQDNLLMNGSRSMEFSSCCSQAGCPGGKPQKTVFRGGFSSRKSLKKVSNINYIN